jgi:aminoglycoside/choline kinase family phosphotransferase
MLMDAPRAAESGPCPPEATPEQRAAVGWNAMARLAAGRVEAFAAAAAYLRARGLSAPEVIALDPEAGLAVVEDLGDALFAREIEAGAAPPPLYEAAIDVLLRLHRETPPAELPVGPGLPPWPLLAYDSVALKAGADLFTAWWPALAGTAPFTPEALAEWDRLWAPIAAAGEAGARVFTLRDYHAENLIWLPQRQGAARVGLLDFQDALRAHPSWDLLSLLQDARREVAPPLEAAMLDRYLAARPEIEAASFRADYAGLAALNAARILGVFARLIVRDGKPKYRAFVPRMQRMLARNLADPALMPLKAWFAAHAPMEAGT